MLKVIVSYYNSRNERVSEVKVEKLENIFKLRFLRHEIASVIAISFNVNFFICKRACSKMKCAFATPTPYSDLQSNYDSQVSVFSFSFPPRLATLFKLLLVRQKPSHAAADAVLKSHLRIVPSS